MNSSSVLAFWNLSCFRYLGLCLRKTIAFHHQKTNSQIMFYKLDWNGRKTTLKVKVSKCNVYLAMGFNSTKLWRITFFKSILINRSQLLACRSGLSCLSDKVTAFVSWETAAKASHRKVPTLPALLSEERAPGIEMCSEGIRWGYPIWQHLSNYLLPSLQRDTRNKTAVLSL